MVGHETGRLARYPGPRRAAVGALVDGVLQVWDPREDGLGRASRGPGGLVEGAPGDRLEGAAVAGAAGWCRRVVADVWEAGHLRPGHPAVGAAPQAVPARGAEVEDVVVIGVHGQPL